MAMVADTNPLCKSSHIDLMRGVCLGLSFKARVTSGFGLALVTAVAQRPFGIGRQGRAGPAGDPSAPQPTCAHWFGQMIVLIISVPL